MRQRALRAALAAHVAERLALDRAVGPGAIVRHPAAAAVPDDVLGADSQPLVNLQDLRRAHRPAGRHLAALGAGDVAALAVGAALLEEVLGYDSFYRPTHQHDGAQRHPARQRARAQHRALVERVHGGNPLGRARLEHRVVAEELHQRQALAVREAGVLLVAIDLMIVGQRGCQHRLESRAAHLVELEEEDVVVAVHVVASGSWPPIRCVIS